MIIIKFVLLLLVTLDYTNISNSIVRLNEPKKVEKLTEGKLVSGVELSKWRMSRKEDKTMDHLRMSKIPFRNQQKKRITKKRKIKPAQDKNKIKKKLKNMIKKNKSVQSKDNSRKNKIRITKYKKILRKDKMKLKQHQKNSRGHKKSSNQIRKKLRISRKNAGDHKLRSNLIAKWEAKQACDEKLLCQKIKDYLKISNQLRKVKRLMKACDTMQKKANKSAEFVATVESLNFVLGSGRRLYLSRSRWVRSSRSNTSIEVIEIRDTLKNCSRTIKEKCQRSSVLACQNETHLAICEKELEDWLKKFGPAKGSCLQNSTNCCDCINKLPEIPKDCLQFDKKSTLAVNSKKNCTTSAIEGSFGFCRKQQILAAEKGPGAVNCQTVVTTGRPPSSSSGGTTTTGSCCPVRCGVKKEGTRIVGGADATVNEYPWMARLLTGLHKCGGSVIADKWILTASHCFFTDKGIQFITNKNITQVKITIGEHDQEVINETTLTKSVTPNFLITHEGYAFDDSMNDIALVRVPAVDLKVYTPVCLPVQGREYTKEKAWFYGWGEKSHIKLQEFRLPILHDATAKQQYIANANILLSEAKLAVMVFSGGKLNITGCEGYSGGPFTFDNNARHEQVGVMSWGLSCTKDRLAGISAQYAAVSAFRTWIDDEIKKNGGATFTC